MSKLIFLTGMPGSGKSFWAEKISGVTGCPWMDMDTLMEAGQQFSIADIFTARGESGFRQMERELLHHIILNENTTTIVACGGGTPCFFDNMQRMKDAGIVIYLKAEISTLRKHLFREVESRPLLRHPDGLDKRLQELITERSPFYEQADYIFRVENLSLTNFTEIIPSCINQH